MRNLAKNVRELKRVTGGSTEVGWNCDETALLLYALIKFFRPDVVVQTGHLWGKTACVILEALHSELIIEEDPAHGDLAFQQQMALHGPPRVADPRLVSIDPHPAGVPDWKAGIQFLHDRYDGFEFFEMTSAEFWASRTVKGERILVFLDGSHERTALELDLWGAYKARAAAIVVVDTICPWLGHMRQLLAEFARDHGYQSLTLPWYNGVTVMVPCAY